MGGQLPEPTNLDAWLELVANEEGAGRAILSENCPIEAMEKAMQLFPRLESQVVYNAHAPGKILERVFKNADWYSTRSTIVEHKNATESILLDALTDQVEQVRASLAKVTTDAEFLKTLASDDSMSVKFNVARNPNSTSDVLTLLLEPFLPNVAAGVLENPNCTATIFKFVASQSLETDPGPNNVTGDWTSSPLLANAPADMLGDVFAKVLAPYRFHIMKNPHASMSQLLQGINDAEKIGDGEAIRSLLKRENLPEEILLSAIDKVTKNLLGNLANYKFLTQQAVNALIELNSIDLTVALINNPTVSGAFLMPLIENKSKKIQNALRQENYTSWEPGASLTSFATKYVGREQLWAALSGGSSRSMYEVELSIASEPFIERFDGKEVSRYDSPSSMLDRDSTFSAYPCVFGELLDEFRESPLGELLESGEGLEPTENDFVALESESWGYFVHRHFDTVDGGWDVIYSKSTGVSFNVEADTLSDVRDLCVSNALKFLRVGDYGDSMGIYKIFGTVRLNSELLVVEELWFTDQGMKKQIEDGETGAMLEF
jgi:hypothetical protein